eukprot:TRINITY_DN2471_c0_g2_i1.p1 TRINITY_DN2471_c0_g2~~TRINITY_DN2471_c0_g2_i1.p1  ORF type:complete len:114 (+),score=11.39 TRINITY_DN2471_c0_g2_i1:44-385(+)
MCIRDSCIAREQIFICIDLRGNNFTKTTDCASNGSSSSCVHDPSTTSHGLLATLAVPDTNSLSLNGILAAEVASVSCVLCDFNFLHLLSETRTITSSVLSDDSDLLCSLGHCG